MNKKQRKKYILELLKKQETVKVSDIIKVFNIERTTVYRDFKELLNENLIEELSK